jgi:hypothetical protein
MPQRVRLSRARGWRKPEDTVVVARPSKWGNPYRIGAPVPVAERERHGWPAVHTRASAVEAYRLDVAGRPPEFREAVRAELHGKNLACWCPLDGPCHADVLLEIANADR